MSSKNFSSLLHFQMGLFNLCPSDDISRGFSFRCWKDRPIIISVLTFPSTLINNLEAAMTLPRPVINYCLVSDLDSLRVKWSIWLSQTNHTFVRGDGGERKKHVRNYHIIHDIRLSSNFVIIWFISLTIFPLVWYILRRLFFLMREREREREMLTCHITHVILYRLVRAVSLTLSKAEETKWRLLLKYHWFIISFNLCEFITPVLTGCFSLTSEFPRVSRTRLSILVDHNSVMIWMASILLLTSFFSLLSKPFGIIQAHRLQFV